MAGGLGVLGRRIATYAGEMLLPGSKRSSELDDAVAFGSRGISFALLRVFCEDAEDSPGIKDVSGLLVTSHYIVQEA